MELRLDTLLVAELEQRHEVVDVAVNASVRYEAHEVELRPAPLHRVDRALDRGVGVERARRDLLRDARDVLVDHAAGAHRHVADFGVPHLSGRETDGFARGFELRARVLRRATKERRARLRGRVARAAVADAEAVENDQHDGPH